MVHNKARVDDYNTEHEDSVVDSGNIHYQTEEKVKKKNNFKCKP